MPRHKTVFLTYYGLDGACAAAVGLTADPTATVVTTSARRIAETLGQLNVAAHTEVHICGVGVQCDWDALQGACRSIKKKKCAIYWHCGRGYLVPHRDRLRPLCTLNFTSSGTNSAALAKHFAQTRNHYTQFLTALAACDPNIGSPAAADPTAEQRKWFDLVDSAISQYFKYQDEQAYIDTIGRLATANFGVEEQQTVDFYRQTGFRYVLHGRSKAIQALRERIRKCAVVDRPVIILGESGVGKEHVAHLLREASTRREEPFIAINCALYAGNAGLANSDLFGHVKGAFTGAEQARQGRFILADKGILYLDEVGELPLDVQAKLLRVLEDGWITPEGADKPQRQVNVRIIAATNRDLPAMVRQGLFRADLYHRLSTLRIIVPPLRDRPDDIRRIVEERLALLATQGYDRTVSPRDYAALRAYSWPGNIRQLIKLIERAVYLDLTISEALDEEHALGALTQQSSEPDTDRLLLPQSPREVLPMKQLQQGYARHVWELCDRNYTAAAKALHVQPNTLRYSYLADE